MAFPVERSPRSVVGVYSPTMESTLLQIVGLLGPLFLLGAYALLSSGRLQATAPAYQILNLMGAAVMVWVGIVTNVWSVWVLNGVWSLIAVFGLVRILRRQPASES